MTPGQSKLPSDSIKVVPGRSKLRVESSNPVARGNPIQRPSKVKLITPEEAIKLHSGASQVPVPPPCESSRPHKPSRPTFVSSRREPARVTFESSRPKPVHATFESQRREHARASFESQRPKPVPPASVSSRSEPARVTFESQRPKPVPETFERPRHVQARSTSKPPRPVPPRPTSKPPRPVPARPAEGFRKEIVCGLRAASCMETTTVRRRSGHQPKTVELPPSPSPLQIPSKVQQQASDATTHTIEETVVEAKDNGSKETCGSTSEERISELLLYRPALLPTWKGHIVDSAMLFPEFDCQFRAKPAASISNKALRLSKAMPIFLEAALVPKGHILSDLFGRNPRLSDVELYFFSHEKETERSKREHAHLFEAMVTRKAMIKASVNGTELLIFSSELLDKISQFFIKKQAKTEDCLWGFFLHNKNSQPHVPGTDENLDDANVVDMDIDPEDLTPGNLHKKVSLPPGFEKTWTPHSSWPCGSSGERPSCSYR